MNLAYYGVRALEATAAVCDQQTVADSMLNFTKTLLNQTMLTHLTRIYAQQPRSSQDGLSVLYCQNQPSNLELRRVYPCQYADYDLTKFTNNAAIGTLGTYPPGLGAITPPGSCPDHSGPVPSGAYLQDSANNSSTQALSRRANGGRTGTTSKGYSLVKRDVEDGGAAPQPPDANATATPTEITPSDLSTIPDPASQPASTDIPPVNNAASPESTPPSSTTDAATTTTDTSASPVPTQTNVIVDPNQFAASPSGTTT
jgi:hypothetical protein